MSAIVYRGRFAPTPSGPLHLGSLTAALASFLRARRAGGQWLLRIDDLDHERCRLEFADEIQRQLEVHGLHWDEAPRRQSQHVAAYESAYQQLRGLGLLYPCSCTRARLARESRSGPDGPVYSGICRNNAATGERLAWRLRVAPGTVALDDPWQGRLSRDLEREVGDFIVRRADGSVGYQLACVVDEAEMAITEVVRGADLIGSSLRQLHLQRLLNLRTPAYRHLPVLKDAAGRKLSKQNHAPAIDSRRAAENLREALRCLGQSVPAELAGSGAAEALAWALEHWNDAAVAGWPSTQALA